MDENEKWPPNFEPAVKLNLAYGFSQKQGEGTIKKLRGFVRKKFGPVAPLYGRQHPWGLPLPRKISWPTGSLASPRLLHNVQDDLARMSEGGRQWAVGIGSGLTAPTPNTQRPTPNAQHPTPNTQRPTPNAQRPTPNTQRPTPNTQRPTPNA